jgi:hypothetical protein
MIYAKELFSCILGMDDFGDEERKRTLEMREEDKEEDNGDEGEEVKEEDIGDEGDKEKNPLTKQEGIKKTAPYYVF